MSEITQGFGLQGENAPAAVETEDTLHGFRPLMKTHARIGEAYKIFAVNLILMVFTLGFYYFWAKTRYRRYFWGSAEIAGDRAEYTGTGWELMKSILIVGLLIMMPIFVATQVVQHMVGDFIVALAVSYAPYLVFFILAPFAIFLSRRFILSRTQWRGIRGGQSGSAKTYFGLFHKYYLLNAACLGFIAPIRDIRLAEYRINNTWLGSLQMKFKGDHRPLMKMNLIITLMMWVLLGYVLSIVVPTAIAWFEAVVLVSSEAAYGPDDLEPFINQLEILQNHQIFLGLAVLGLIILRLVYRVYLYQHIVSEMKAGDWRFKTDITVGNVFGLTAATFALTFLTLGLGIPVAKVLVARFLARHAYISGPENDDVLLQSDQEKPASGEGLADVIDVGDFG